MDIKKARIAATEYIIRHRPVLKEAENPFPDLVIGLYLYEFVEETKEVASYQEIEKEILSTHSIIVPVQSMFVSLYKKACM